MAGIDDFLRGQYRNYYSGLLTTDEGGQQHFNGVSEDEWNRMTPQQQLGLLYGPGNAVQPQIRPGQPGYDELHQQVGGGDGRNVVVTNASMANRGYLNPGSREYSNNGIYAHSEDSQTPDFQHLDDQNWNYGMLALFPALAMGGAALMGQFGGAGAAAGGAAETAGTAGTGGYGMLAPGMESQAVLESGLLNSGVLPGSAEWTAAGGGAFGGAAGGAGAEAGGLPHMNPPGMVAPGMENAAMADSWLINNGLPQLAGGSLTGALSGSFGGLLSSVMSNPLRALSLLQMGRGLLGGGGSSGGGGGDGDGGSGGGGPVGTAKIGAPQFYRNPHTVAQLQNFQYARPRGLL